MATVICFAFNLTLFSEEPSECSAVNKVHSDCCHTNCCTPNDYCCPSWLYVGAYGGYGVISGMIDSDGEVAQARFAIGAESPQWACMIFGGEAGIQSGNTMRLKASQAIIDDAGGLPIQTTLKPFVDALATFKWRFIDPFSLIIKGGIAYRQLQFEDRTSDRDSLKRINAEVQGGFSYQLNPRARLIAYYQRIFSRANAKVELESNSDVTIGEIPTQQGGFIGIEYSL